MNNKLKGGVRWLDQAEANLKTSRDCLRAENYLCIMLFPSAGRGEGPQGVFVLKGFRALVTHSLTDLLEEAAKSLENFQGLAGHGNELDRHYIGSRYPNFSPSGAPYRYYT